jgi:ATP-dependent DNA helicase RecQ
MLTGSGSEKIARFGLTRLSTFGILAGSGLKQAEVVQILDALTAAGLIAAEDVDRFKPVVNLTAAGWAWLRGQDPADVCLVLPDDVLAKVCRRGRVRRDAPTEPRPPGAGAHPGPADVPIGPEDEPDDEASADPAPPSSRDDDSLLERLRSLRAGLAREVGLSPGYVLSNETLEALVRHRPGTPPELAAIKGIGPSKLERYGAALLEALRPGPPEPRPARPPAPTDPSIPAQEGPPKDRASGPDTESPRSVAFTPSPTRGEGERSLVPTIPNPAPVATGSYVPTEEWTWRLLDRGFTLEEAAAIRGLEPAAIIRHATWVARQGRPIPLESFLSPEVIGRWEAWRRVHGAAGPPPENGAASGLWQLYLACRKPE